MTIKADRAFEVIALNKNGVKPEQLNPEGEAQKAERKAFGDILGQDAINRFDKKKKPKGKGGGKGAKEAKGKAGGRQSAGKGSGKPGKEGNGRPQQHAGSKPQQQGEKRPGQQHRWQRNNDRKPKGNVPKENNNSSNNNNAPKANQENKD